MATTSAPPGATLLGTRGEERVGVRQPTDARVLEHPDEQHEVEGLVDADVGDRPRDHFDLVEVCAARGHDLGPSQGRLHRDHVVAAIAEPPGEHAGARARPRGSGHRVRW